MWDGCNVKRALLSPGYSAWHMGCLSRPSALYPGPPQWWPLGVTTFIFTTVVTAPATAFSLLLLSSLQLPSSWLSPCRGVLVFLPHWTPLCTFSPSVSSSTIKGSLASAQVCSLVTPFRQRSTWKSAARNWEGPNWALYQTVRFPGKSPCSLNSSFTRLSNAPREKRQQCYHSIRNPRW